MSHLDERTRQRLDRLRATDVTGVYAGDAHSVGTDPAGAVTVTLDPTLRVVQVDIGAADLVRTEETLNAAVTAACVVAVSARYATNAGGPPPPSQRPQAKRVRLEVRRPTPEMLSRHQTRARTNARPRSPVPKVGVGFSANGCVSVTLPPIGARGRITADAGWLQQANASRLGAAVTEAYLAAYTRGDS